jgi:hypothetical protein
MESLFLSHSLDVERAYIICVDNNAASMALAQRCAKSCDDVGQPWSYWSAFDGIKDRIVVPAQAANDNLIKMIKVTDHYMTRGEVACALSHISLWSLCAAQDQPIVILEHDAIMLQAYRKHAVYNSICYLGGKEQVKQGWQVFPTPPHASEGPNYHFICRAHAYALDPAVARNLLSHVLRFGIHAPLDIMIRADIFPIYQMGVYAYDDDGSPGQTTILGRPLEGRNTERNDDLAR